MSRISGYFLLGSKSAGFTIQPWIFIPSFDVYQISSVVASFLPINTSSLTSVSHLMLPGELRLRPTTSAECDDVLITPTALPFGLIDVTFNTCLPDVTGFTSPDDSDATYRLRDPSFSALK